MNYDILLRGCKHLFFFSSLSKRYYYYDKSGFITRRFMSFRVKMFRAGFKTSRVVSTDVLEQITWQCYQ